MDFKTDNKMEYILNFLDYSIKQYVEDVMEDSEIDPEFSAVTLNNVVVCYIHFMKTLGAECVSKNVKDLFKNYGYSEKEFEIFERKRQLESKYYVGEQFKNNVD